MEALALVESPSEVTVTADWRYQECAKAVRQISSYRLGPPWLRWAKRVAIIALCLGGVFLIFGFSVQGWAALVGGAPWIVLILLWLVLLSGGFAWIAAWQIKRNNPHLVAGQEHHISASGYQVRCGATTSTTAWEGIQRFVETPAFFLVYPVRNAAYYLPKRCLTSMEIETIRQLAMIGLPGTSRLVAV
jgi:hypothetical protein